MTEYKDALIRAVLQQADYDRVESRAGVGRFVAGQQVGRAYDRERVALLEYEKQRGVAGARESEVGQWLRRWEDDVRGVAADVDTDTATGRSRLVREVNRLTEEAVDWLHA